MHVGIGDPVVEGWPIESAPTEEDHEPPPPPPHSPSASEEEEEDEDDDVDSDEDESDGEGSESLVVVSREEIPTATAAPSLPFMHQGESRTGDLRRQPQPLTSLLEAQDWNDSRSLARGRYARTAAAHTKASHVSQCLVACASVQNADMYIFAYSH